MDTNAPLPARLLKEYRKMAQRKFRTQQGKMILEGVQLVKEALLAGVELESLLYTPQFAARPSAKELLAGVGKARVFPVDPATFASIAETETPQGIAAMARIPEQRTDIFFQEKGFFLLLDRIQDPGNLGTIIRTAAAAGVSGIILLQGTTDPYSPKVLRSSMGGVFYVPIVHENDLPDWFEKIKRQGVQLIAADPKGTMPYYNIDFRKSTAVIIGNESGGVGKMLLEKAKTKAYIPLQGKFNILNAAIAAAAFILENQRQKEFHLIAQKPEVRN